MKFLQNEETNRHEGHPEEKPKDNGMAKTIAMGHREKLINGDIHHNSSDKG